MKKVIGWVLVVGVVVFSWLIWKFTDEYLRPYKKQSVRYY